VSVSAEMMQPVKIIMSTASVTFVRLRGGSGDGRRHNDAKAAVQCSLTSN
jgi:hypothetical protein